MTKLQADFYESRYSQPYRGAAWSQEGQVQCLTRRQRPNWSRLDIRQFSEAPGTPRKSVKTRFRKVLRSGIEAGAFGTIFATFLSSLYMFG